MPGGSHEADLQLGREPVVEGPQAAAEAGDHRRDRRRGLDQEDDPHRDVRRHARDFARLAAFAQQEVRLHKALDRGARIVGRADEYAPGHPLGPGGGGGEREYDRQR